MGIGVSIFLIAVGTILAWAVSLDTNGIDLNMAGVILMIVGILGLLLSLIFWSTWAGSAAGAVRPSTAKAEIPTTTAGRCRKAHARGNERAAHGPPLFVSFALPASARRAR
jgi:Domain of unknown function (DUF6458)